MAMADHDVFYLIIEFFAKYVTNFKAVVIANNQANFSVGGNLKFMLTNANNPLLVDEYLKLGQTAMLALKYSPIPVVSVLKGMALGGGSELLLHSSAIVAHIETNSGLVEAGAGLIPSWGGCKEMILRSTTSEELIVAFKNIITGKISSSAYELQAMLKLDQCKIVMNINRLLFESKALALTLKNQPKPNNISTQINWEKVISELNLTGYDQILAQELISLFTMNNPNEQELLEQERKIFIKLLGNKLTQERINYMLETGKRLKN